MFGINRENLKKLKYCIFQITLNLSIVYRKWAHEYEKIFNEEKSTKILKTLGLITNIEKYHKIYYHV